MVPFILITIASLSRMFRLPSLGNSCLRDLHPIWLLSSLGARHHKSRACEGDLWGIVTSSRSGVRRRRDERPPPLDTLLNTSERIDLTVTLTRLATESASPFDGCLTLLAYPR